MLAEVNQLEYSSPSSTAAEYTNHWISILPNYEAGLQTTIVEDHLSLEARRLLAELIRSTINDSNHQLSIEQLKFLEDEIAQSGLINAATRQYLLAYSSMIRNIVWAIHNAGIILAGTHYTHTELAAAWWNCWDQYFNQTQDSWAVFGNYNSPFAMAAAWATFPVSVCVALGDSIFQATVNTINDPNC